MDNYSTIMTLNLSKICRICFNESNTMHSIYAPLPMKGFEEEEVYPVYQVLMNISSMKIDSNDSLPNLICSSCLEATETCFKFQKQCNQSQDILDTYLLQSNEIEICSKVEKTQQASKELLNSIKDEFDDTSDGTITFVALKDILSDTRQTSTDEKSNNETAFLKCTNPVSNNNNTILTDNGSLNNDGKKLTGSSSLGEGDGGSGIGTGKDKSESVDKTVNCKSKVNRKPIRRKNSIKENIEKKIYTCNQCDKSYKFRSSLSTHKQKHSQEKLHTCQLCNKSYKHYASLSNHHRTHSGEYRHYSCEICGKKYRQSGSLKAHMRIHTGQRPFLCSICGKGFRQNPDLTYHMRTHTKEKPYMCSFCGKTMSMQSHLVQHMRSHTGERPFKCQFCEKAFPSTTRLKRHVIIHSDVKPYACEVCHKSFNRRNSLSVHSKIHTDERPHVCHICGKDFIQPHTLKSHLLTHLTEAAKELGDLQ